MTVAMVAADDEHEPADDQPGIPHGHAVAAVRDDAAHHARRVDGADDRGDDPPGLVGEEVVGRVVDGLVLDDDHALLLDRFLDHPLPDLVAGERDDECGHADQGDERALKGADQSADPDCGEDRDERRHVPIRSHQRQLGDDDAADAADEADREVDLPDQQDEDDAVGEQGHPGHLRDDVAEVARAEEVGRLEREEGDDDHEPHEHRGAAEVAGADVVPHALNEALLRLRGGQGLGAHTGASGEVDAIPATFVGTPAVIASTTSCCVVRLRS